MLTGISSSVLQMCLFGLRSRQSFFFVYFREEQARELYRRLREKPRGKWAFMPASGALLSQVWGIGTLCQPPGGTVQLLSSFQTNELKVTVRKWYGCYFRQSKALKRKCEWFIPSSGISPDFPTWGGMWRSSETVWSHFLTPLWCV